MTATVDPIAFELFKNAVFSIAVGKVADLNGLDIDLASVRQ